jgi:hypothetical protein
MPQEVLMRTENEARNPDSKRSKKLVLHKETIKNLAANGGPPNLPEEYPSDCVICGSVTMDPTEFCNN